MNNDIKIIRSNKIQSDETECQSFAGKTKLYSFNSHLSTNIKTPKLSSGSAG